MQTLKKRPPGLTSLAKRSGFWGQNLRKFHPKPSQSDLGRFISADPIGFAGGLNLYAYVGNNPTNNVDPEGLWDGGAFAEGAEKSIYGLVVGGTIGFAITVLAPEALVGGIVLAGTTYFAVNLAASAYQLLSGKKLDGTDLTDYQYSRLAGETSVSLVSLGFSKLPQMKMGRENVPGYFKEGPCGRVKYEWKKATLSDEAFQSGQSSLSGLRPLKAFSPAMMATGPTPGAPVATQMARNLTNHTIVRQAEGPSLLIKLPPLQRLH